MSAKARKSPLKILPCAVFLAAAAALGSEVGDSYEKVLAEKGAPKSQMQAGAVRILSYSDETIKLRDDVVVSIKAVAVAPPQSVPPPQPGTPPNAAGQPATPAVRRHGRAADSRQRRVRADRDESCLPKRQIHC